MGKRDREPPELLQPIGVLQKILRHHTDSNRRRPKMFPSAVREAAQYWLDHQEPPDDYREGVREIRSNGTLIAYETPYHDRVARTLKKFLALKELHQVYIIEAIEAGTPWRGDEIWSFKDIVREAEKMRQDPKAYIEKGRRMLGQSA